MQYAILGRHLLYNVLTCVVHFETYRQVMKILEFDEKRNATSWLLHNLEANSAEKE